MCGELPFGEQNEDPYDVYEEIIKKEISFPAHLKDKKAKKLMDQLLSKVPDIRLGGSYRALKENPWFENFDWVSVQAQLIEKKKDKLIEKEIKTPYTPSIEKYFSNEELREMEEQNKMVIDVIFVPVKTCGKLKKIGGPVKETAPKKRRKRKCKLSGRLGKRLLRGIFSLMVFGINLISNLERKILF